MKHVSEGELPANLEEQRTRMFQGTDAPTHTATIESAFAYQSMGMENSFSIERFRENFKVEVHALNDEEITFDLIGIDAALANAFRRILLAEVPTMAIEKVFILNNTSMIQDEVLAQRLGLIPIRADPRKFNARQPDEDADADNVISFRLQVRCSRQRQDVAGGGGGGSSSAAAGDDAEVVGARVTSNDLEWIAQGDQDERFADDPIRPVHDDILIARLRPGQEIELEAWCEKGVGKTHAKWSPVCTASYRLLPEIKVSPPAAKAPASADPLTPSQPPACPTRVFDVDAASGGATPAASRPRACNMCVPCAKQAGWEERVHLRRVKDHFIFSVESTGSLPPEVLFKEAVKTLMQKTVDIAQLLNDAVAGQKGLS